MSVLALGVGVRPTWAMANERRAEIPSYGRVHYWQMKQWADNTVQCELFLEHNEFPTNEDIETYCGTQSLAAWNNTPPCAAVSESGQTQSCAGSFMVDYGRDRNRGHP
ncbi:MAG TPA: hypothetical protein VHO48_05650 [Anaerolineaceae bacterium]|nr:hypothetical protein [Anaerolineaceae bacterium]